MPAKKQRESTANLEALETKRQELLAALDNRFDTNAKAEARAEEDQAQVSHDEFVSLRLNKFEYDLLRLVNEALDRYGAGDYGVCQRCDEPIAPRRLEVLPWAKYCVRCQEQISRREAAGPAETEMETSSAW